MEKSYRKRRELFERKSSDYATEDVLSNFKRVGKLIETLGIDPTTPHGVACVYILLKLDRFCNLVFRKKKKPDNEAIQDTIDDLKNYMDLMEACYLESLGELSTRQEASSSRDG